MTIGVQHPHLDAETGWLFLTDSFRSIVADRDDPDLLLVRARAAGDINAVFPTAVVECTSKRDYRYCADINRQSVADAIAERVAGIVYSNFKETIPLA